MHHIRSTSASRHRRVSVSCSGTTATRGLVALNYNVSNALVLDVAGSWCVARSPDWQLMAGMTVRLGHWF
jgi:hypothetical protein